MKPTKKKAATFRLSENTLKDLEKLAEKHKISQADVITVLANAISRYDEEELAEKIQHDLGIAERLG